MSLVRAIDWGALWRCIWPRVVMTFGVHYSTSEDAALAVVAEIKAMGRNATAVQADLLIEVDAQSLVSRAAEQLGGPILCLVNNASTFET